MTHSSLRPRPPAASQTAPGTPFTAALTRSHLSAPQLVRAVNVKLEATGLPALHPTTAYNWCTGSMPRSPHVRSLVALTLSEATGTTVTADELWGPSTQPRPVLSAADELLGPRRLPDVLNTAAHWSAETTVHADTQPATPTTLFTAVWDATHQPPSPACAMRHSAPRVEPAMINLLEEHLSSLRHLDDQTGGGPLAQRRVRIALSEVILLLRTSSHTPDVRTRLLHNAAGLSQLGGWMAFDSNLTAAAQRYQLLALRLARAADDTDTVSNILGMLAYQYAATGHPQEALRYATAAVEHAARSLPLVRARALGRLATAHAAAGDIDRFRRTHEECRALITRRTPGDPSCLYYFTDEQLAAETGHALVELATTHHRQTRALLSEASRLLTPHVRQGGVTGYRRSAVLHGIHLARAHLLARDTEATAAVLTHVAAGLAGVQSPRCRALLRALRTRAGRRLRTAGHPHALEAVDRALSST
ncbi:hypothetical protein [Streptomyces lavenduligriseus]|uniref:Transcriptional regulator n=1 Tax=Streptomyces lavenduligriseus TaxID=67315 RepID=A0ABT0P588_9ACTN|nr:hypothetical protein [Streptomyces lavenduligriseus]MCL3998736.1 hypothetical protein [Streptomyces lavenduligriseus]